MVIVGLEHAKPGDTVVNRLSGKAGKVVEVTPDYLVIEMDATGYQWRLGLAPNPIRSIPPVWQLRPALTNPDAVAARMAHYMEALTQIADYDWHTGEGTWAAMFDVVMDLQRIARKAITNPYEPPPSLGGGE